jgi:hypothetical protein
VKLSRQDSTDVAVEVEEEVDEAVAGEMIAAEEVADGRTKRPRRRAQSVRMTRPRNVNVSPMQNWKK